MTKQLYKIDGSNFSTLEGFAVEFTKQLNLRISWKGNLDAFNDILRGELGTPEEGFILVWKNSSLSRENLGYLETVRQLERKLERCHPSNRELIKAQLEQAKRGKGATVFDWLVEIIEDEAHQDIELRLE